MTSDIKTMTDEAASLSSNKTDIKLPPRKNVIPITSISDLGTLVNEIQNQLNMLTDKMESNTSPEFKALMEGYVKKANEVEDLKVHIENYKSQYEELKSEILKIRETNRNLINELQNARETLKNLERELNALQITSNKNEEEYKIKIENLNAEIKKNGNKIKELEDEIIKAKEEMEADTVHIMSENERLKEENQEQNFSFRQIELELTSERDSLKKQVKEFEVLLKEQHEQIELKTKEAEYKEALLNQLIKQGTIEKLPQKPQIAYESLENDQKKRKSWFSK